MRHARHLATSVVALLGLACGGQQRSEVAAAEVGGSGRMIVGPARTTLVPGLTQQLLAVVQDARGEPRDDAGVRWSSADPRVATVSPGGLVTAVALGTTTLRATAGALTGVVQLTVRREPVTTQRLVDHRDVVTTVFWVGEGADASNEFISNAQSAFDERWLEHFGGVDAPRPRAGLRPARFTPRENPFYFALPYTDLDEQGRRKTNAAQVVPWAASRRFSAGESMVKNQWIRVTSRRTGTACFAQWEDAGPGIYDDFQYVFGTAAPSNPFVLRGVRLSSALDVSPAVRDCLGERDDVLRVDWRFVAERDVPEGPWREIVTRRQLAP